MSNIIMTVTQQGGQYGNKRLSPTEHKNILKYRTILKSLQAYRNDPVVSTSISNLRNIVTALRGVTKDKIYTKYLLKTKRHGQTINATAYSRAEALSELRAQIRSHRQSHKYIREQTRSIYLGDESFHYQKVGGVHKYPGDYINAMRMKRSLEVYKSKKPLTSEEHLAVEIECFAPISRSTLGTMFFEKGLSKYLTLKDDGSLRPDPNCTSFEIVVCASKSEILRVLADVCQILSEAGARVNKSCGLHVHLDMRGKSREVIERIFSNLVSSSKMLYRMMPPSRLKGTNGYNQYCKPNRFKDFERNRKDRYQGINACSYNRHTTLEVRLHSGTVDFTKIANFILILDKIASHPEVIRRSATTVSGFVKQWGLSSGLGGYIESRIEKFKAAHESNDLNREE